MDKTKLTFLLSLVFGLMAAGCGSTPRHSGAPVAGTTAPANSGCRAVSNLNGLPSMPQFGDAATDLRSQVVGTSGNVTFVESGNRGTTYHCDPGSSPK